jgi:hypothetical protein
VVRADWRFRQFSTYRAISFHYRNRVPESIWALWHGRQGASRRAAPIAQCGPRFPPTRPTSCSTAAGAFVILEDIIAKRLGWGGFGFHQLSENYQVGVDGFAGRSSVPPRSWHEICYASWQCGLRMGIDGACHNFLEEANKATIDSRWFCGKPRNRVRAE